VRSWEEHLAQHRRIDDASAEIIRAARVFDISETGPIARHSITVDVSAGPRPLPVAGDDGDHRAMHAVDGSIPLATMPDPAVAPSSDGTSARSPHPARTNRRPRLRWRK